MKTIKNGFSAQHAHLFKFKEGSVNELLQGIVTRRVHKILDEVVNVMTDENLNVEPLWETSEGVIEFIESRDPRLYTWLRSKAYRQPIDLTDNHYDAQELVQRDVYNTVGYYTHNHHAGFKIVESEHDVVIVKVDTLSYYGVMFDAGYDFTEADEQCCPDCTVNLNLLRIGRMKDAVKEFIRDHPDKVDNVMDNIHVIVGYIKKVFGDDSFDAFYYDFVVELLNEVRKDNEA